MSNLEPKPPERESTNGNRSASSSDSEFTTVKIRKNFRRWLKMKAADEGIPMYELLENLAAGPSLDLPRPWE